EQLGRTPADIVMADSMKTKAADFPLFKPLPGQWIALCRLRHGAVKAGVEHRHLRNAAEQTFDSLYAEQVKRIVQRRQLRALGYRLFDCLIDQNRLLVIGAAMHNA